MLDGMTPGTIGRLHLVHLLAPRHTGDGGLMACAGVMAGLGGAADRVVQHVWLLGGSHDERRAWAHGIEVVDRISGPAPWDILTRRALARLHGVRRAEWGRPADAVVCWSRGAVRLARAAMPGVRLVRVDLDGTEEAGDSCDSDLGETVIAFRHGENVPMYGILPPRAQDRAARRAELGIADHEVAVLLLADPPQEGDARRFCASVGMACFGGAPVVALVSESAGQWRRAVRYSRMHARQWDVVTFRGPMVEAAPAADIAVWDPGMNERGAIAARRIAALGVPVLVPDTSVSRAVLGDPGEPGTSGEFGALRAKDMSAPAMVAKLLPLIDHAEWRVRLGGMQRDMVERASRGAGEVLTRVILRAAAPGAAEHGEPVGCGPGGGLVNA